MATPTLRSPKITPALKAFDGPRPSRYTRCTPPSVKALTTPLTTDPPPVPYTRTLSSLYIIPGSLFSRKFLSHLPLEKNYLPPNLPPMQSRAKLSKLRFFFLSYYCLI